MTAALEGGEWSAARPGRTLPPRKTRYPLYRRLGGPQGRSGLAENLENTNAMYLKDTVFNDVEWFLLAHERIQRRWVLNTVMKLWVP